MFVQYKDSTWINFNEDEVVDLTYPQLLNSTNCIFVEIAARYNLTIDKLIYICTECEIENLIPWKALDQILSQTQDIEEIRDILYNYHEIITNKTARDILVDLIEQNRDLQVQRSSKFRVVNFGIFGEFSIHFRFT